MSNTLTWLHLSDLHMRRDELHNLQVVLRALWHDLPGQVERAGGRLDFIVFTGDIAYSGKDEQYKLAEEHFFNPLLETTDLSPMELFLVPGNHDVDWSLISQLHPNIPLSLDNRDKVTELLSDEGRRRLLLTPMSSYARFVKRYFGPVSDHQMIRDEPYYSVQHVGSEAPSVALIGLNSAWLSGFTKDARGDVNDYGSLLIGDKQIGDAIRETDEATIRIALMHHPLSWLKQFDQRDVKRWLQPSCDFVLRGHLHDPDFVEEKALGRDTITIPAGTVYQSREWLNGYNVVQLNFKSGKGKIWLFRYSEARHEWVEDVMSTGKGTDGTVEFDLPGALGQLDQLIDQPSMSSSPPAVPVPASRASMTGQLLSNIEPCWLRLGRKRDVQLVEAFLTQQREEGDALWIWGEEECGLMEFLQIVRGLLRQDNAETVYFDAQDAAFGIAVGQNYFLDKLERWAGIAPTSLSEEMIGGSDERSNRLLTEAEEHLESSERRLFLVFANSHLLAPAVREWVYGTLWGELLQPLKQHQVSAIFACEGSAPACPASDHDNRVYLGEFTFQDVEKFLRTVPSITSNEIPALAREIHSQGADEFLAPPRRVYQNLIVELNRRGLCGRYG